MSSPFSSGQRKVQSKAPSSTAAVATPQKSPSKFWTQAASPHSPQRGYNSGVSPSTEAGTLMSSPDMDMDWRSSEGEDASWWRHRHGVRDPAASSSAWLSPGTASSGGGRQRCINEGRQPQLLFPAQGVRISPATTLSADAVPFVMPGQGGRLPSSPELEPMRGTGDWTRPVARSIAQAPPASSMSSSSSVGIPTVPASSRMHRRGSNSSGSGEDQSKVGGRGVQLGHPKPTRPLPRRLLRASDESWQDESPLASARSRPGSVHSHLTASPSLASSCRASPMPMRDLQILVVEVGGKEMRRRVRMESGCTVSELRARHLSKELAEGYQIRFISSGRLLNEDALLSSVPDGSVIQCYLSMGLGQSAARKTSSSTEDESEQGRAQANVLPDLSFDALFEEATLQAKELASHLLCVWQGSMSTKTLGVSVGLVCLWGAYFVQALPYREMSHAALSLASLAWPVLLSIRANPSAHSDRAA
eukprot:TRINITY_DN35723_c0_g1_i1.p1 TRINITY_DN35723_c0_g1~~TRINITY_DN35723_c0_g1_i1.p1  ORF type:complete len:476 (+),score=53.15 TRINITY_DN35723_c0_g1_i1:119-1546(+)